MESQSHPFSSQTITTSAPVVVQQFGDKVIVELALFVLRVQKDIIHQALQEGHSCAQQSILIPDTPDIHGHKWGV